MKNLNDPNWLQKKIFEFAEKEARQYYFKNLAGNEVKSGALRENIYFSEEGWNHFVEKKRSLNDLIIRFFALPRAEMVLKNGRKVGESKKVGKGDITVEYWELQSIVRSVLVSVVVCSINKGEKFFLTCRWLGTKNKELSLTPMLSQLDRRRGLNTPQLSNRKILTKKTGFVKKNYEKTK